MDDDRVDHRFLSAFVLVTLKAMRRKNMLKPADLTELRLALQSGSRGPVYERLKRVLDETVLEKEERRETPRKPG